MSIDTKCVAAVLAAARARMASVLVPGAPAALLETEGLDLLAAIGIPAPAHLFVRNAGEAADADTTALGG